MPGLPPDTAVGGERNPAAGAASVGQPGGATGGRSLVLHVDDLGSTSGANAAFLELAARGYVTCGSVMVPCPWFSDLVESVGDEHDVGVHLTLTSEWAGYRWAPISTRSPTSGLVDQDGWMWRDVVSLRRRLVPEAAEAELRAQVERALAAGLRPTHLDAHMAAAMLPNLLDLHVRLGREYGLLPVLPRSITWPPDLEAYRAAVAALDAEHLPMIDHCRGTIPRTGKDLRTAWRDLVRTLPAGSTTHMALHATAPCELRRAAPDHAAWREAEYDLLRDGTVADLCAEESIAVIGLRGLQSAWRERLLPASEA